MTDAAKARLADLDRRRQEVILDAILVRLKELGVAADTKFVESLWQVVEANT